MLSKIIGQEPAKRQLLSAFTHDRLAHAYLLTGEEGLGAEELAIEMTKFIMCSGPDRINSEPCQICPNCKKISMFQHPDVHYYFPVLKSTEESDILTMLEDKSQDLYSKIKVAGGSLHIGDPENPEKNSIRGLIREIGMRSYEGSIKVCIVTFIEEMNEESANALLKILEEPPSHTLYFLTTSHLRTLLPTIISRCQLVKLHKIKTDEIEIVLRHNHSLQSEDSRLIARLADGNYATALQLLSGDLKNKRDMMISFLLGTVSLHSSQIAESVDTLLAENKKDKAFVIDVLNIMSTWFQDAFYVNNLREYSDFLNTLLVNQDKIERIEKFIQSFPRANLDLAAAEIEKAVDLISRNVYLNLILINLGLNLRNLIFNTKN